MSKLVGYVMLQDPWVSSLNASWSFHTSFLSESTYHRRRRVEINSFQFHFIVLKGKFLKPGVKENINTFIKAHMDFNMNCTWRPPLHDDRARFGKCCYCHKAFHHVSGNLVLGFQTPTSTHVSVRNKGSTGFNFNKHNGQRLLWFYGSFWFHICLCVCLCHVSYTAWSVPRCF